MYNINALTQAKLRMQETIAREIAQKEKICKIVVH